MNPGPRFERFVSLSFGTETPGCSVGVSLQRSSSADVQRHAMESTAQHLGVTELKRDTYNDAAPDRVAHVIGPAIFETADYAGEEIQAWVRQASRYRSPALARSKLQFATTSEVRNVATKPSGTDYLFLLDIVRLPDRAAWTVEWALVV